MKQKWLKGGLLLAALTAFWPGRVCGQDATQATAQDDASASAPLQPASRVNWGGPPKAPVRVFMAHRGDRQITVDPSQKYQYIFGMDLTQGYDDGVIVFPSTTGVYYTLWSPTVGIVGQRKNSQFMVQYTPTVSHFANAGPIGTQAFHEGSMEVHTEVSQEWGWDAKVTLENGFYPLSLLNGFNFSSLGGVAAVDPNTILLLTDKTYFNTDATVGLHWKPTLRDKFILASVYNYADFPPNHVPGSVPGHIHRENGVMNYSHILSERANLLVNANVLHVFGTLACTTYGVQVGGNYEIHRGTVISATVGPQFGSGTCANSIFTEYTGYITSRFSKKSEGYLSAARSTTSPIHSSLGGGLTDTYSAGVKRTLSTRVDARVDGGYIRVLALPHVPTSFYARGRYVATHLDWTLRPSMALAFNYSRIYQVVSNLQLNRNQASVTLEWRPGTRSAY